MNKFLKDKSFWIILIVSIITLILLVIGTFYFTNLNKKEFYEAGYIIDSNVTKSSKYYFDKKTEYKENVFNEYVFESTDKKKVKASKENFIHYLDNSLSFMKNGVILDLDNFNETIAPYYNITDKSLVKYNNGAYYIENANKTLVFGNFLGRITDNKYIAAGNSIKVKLSGNDEIVKGEYFEIIFVDEGIVKIENQEGSYQTVADGTLIYVGENIKINLGSKEVFYGDKTKLSLSELTIDGNENIDILPKEENKVKPDKEDNKGNSNEGETIIPDSQDSNENDGNDGNSGDDMPDSSGDGNGETILKKETSVNLIEASADVNTIKTKFQVIDSVGALKGNLVLTLVNTSTGETVYKKILANTSEEQLVVINSLLSDSNYLLTVNLENNDKSIQYFQKSFRTDGLDLKLKRKFVTENSLTYTLDFAKDSKAVAADVTLYDSKNAKINSYKVNKEENTDILFEGLNKNSLYKVVVSNVVIKNVMYDKLYTTETSDYTLKVKPTLGGVEVTTNNESKSFSLKLNDVVDEDKSIVKYVYKIYKSEDLTEKTMSTAKPIYTFERNKIDNELLKLDESKNLFGNTDYKFKVSVLYFDNYRYNEIESIYSDSFNIVGKPTISFEKDIIDFNRISGRVIITDTDCTIPYSGRECNNNMNNFIIKYYGGNSVIRNDIKNIKFDPKTFSLSFDLRGLNENTVYTFEVFADIDLKNGDGIKKGQYIGGFNVSTIGISTFAIQNWKKDAYSFENPISVKAELVSVPPTDDIDKISTMTFNLYSGNVKGNTEISVPIASFTETDGIKDKYYNKEFSLISNMFMYEDVKTKEAKYITDINVLKELSGGKLNRYYTLEVTDCFDEDKSNEFNIVNNVYVYEVPSILLVEDENVPPEILVEEITNIEAKEENEYGLNYDKNLDDEIVRGYKLTAVFDKQKLENYFVGTNPITKINFYAKDKSGNVIETKIIDFVKEEKYSTYFLLDNGTEYEVKDNKLRRGNEYKFSLNLSIDEDGVSETPELFYPSKMTESDSFVPIKQSPSFKYFIDNSTASTITYKYKIIDIDNVLCSEILEEELGNVNKYFIYYKVDENENLFKDQIFKTDEEKTFTLSNLVNSSVYNISYLGAVNKELKPAYINLTSNIFDGFYDLTSQNIKYNLEYSNYDNRLKIVIDNNELLNRISSYLVTLTVGDLKYEEVIDKLTKCSDKQTSEDELNNCIIIDYKNIASFKNKDIKVKVEAFYDTGFIGFSQNSLLDTYFRNKGLIGKNYSGKVGFAYQNESINSPGNYVFVRNGIYDNSFDKPSGIHTFIFDKNNNYNTYWTLNSSNLVDYKNRKFVDNSVNTNLDDRIKINNGNITSFQNKTKFNINPKVLNVTSLKTDNDSFKFTSIIPKIKASTKPFINGVDLSITLSSDPNTIDQDFFKDKDGKYKFYIDLYDKNSCTEEICPKYKTIEVNYEDLENISIDGLIPDTTYIYKVSALMNKNGVGVIIPLFKEVNGYVEFKREFKTFGKDDIFNRVIYNYQSFYDENKYDNRIVNFKTILKQMKNMDIKYTLMDPEGKIVFDEIIKNEDIVVNDKINTCNYSYNVIDENFLYGPGYYTLIIKAITTDLGKELELYNEKLIYDTFNGYDFHSLSNPTIKLSQKAYIKNGNSGEYNYGLSYIISLEDIDKTIKDGIYNVELQNSAYANACQGHEQDCIVNVDIKKNTCKFANGSSKGCNIKASGKDSHSIEVEFENLKSNTNYVIYVSANTYRNNVSLQEKEGLVYLRKSQYTKGNLNFSLGAVTPTAVDKNKLVITFAGAANLQDSLKGIDYNITVQGGEKVSSGSLGKTDFSSGELVFGLDADNYPTITIPIPEGKELGLNNYIIITYYYLDEKGNLVKLKIGEDTSYQYTVKNGN